MTSGVYVEGLRETMRSLEKFGVEVSDMKKAFKKIGDNVVKHAKPSTNPQSGLLASSIRASNTKNKSLIRAGGARVPYAGVIEYGGYNNIVGKEYLRGAVKSNEKETVTILDNEIRSLIRQYDLR